MAYLWASNTVCDSSAVGVPTPALRDHSRTSAIRCSFSSLKMSICSFSTRLVTLEDMVIRHHFQGINSQSLQPHGQDVFPMCLANATPTRKLASQQQSTRLAPCRGRGYPVQAPKCSIATRTGLAMAEHKVYFLIKQVSAPHTQLA